ncbi:amino acid adenylation domain-containing protein, partial [Streptomyces shaanxiensis]
MSIGDTPSTNDQEAAALREELLRSRLAGRRSGRRAPIPRVPREKGLPLSFGQQQLWFLHRMDPASPEYAVPLAMRLHGTLDPEALRAALALIVERHEILRTRYTLAGREPLQVVDEPSAPELPVADLTDMPAAEARTRAEADAGHPFDLEREWPVRPRLYRLGDDEHLLVVTFHHIACDAWSMGVFAQELGAFYTAYSTGTTPTPDPLPVQYADYASWQRGELTGAALERQLAYWREQLADLPVLELPTDRPRPARRDPAGDAVAFTVPADLARRVTEVAGAHGVTRFTVLLTAYQLLLARYTGTTDIPVGVTVSGRSRPELQQLIGYGINVLVARASWQDDPTFAELLAAGRTTVLDAFDHQAVPFATLVDELQPDRDLSRTPLYQADFILRERQAPDLALPGLTVTPETGHRIAKTDLTLDVADATDGPLDARLLFATALFDRTTADRMAGHYLRLLDGLTAAPEARVSTVEMLSDDERALLLGAWAAGETVDRGDATTVDLFTRQAAATPDAVAVRAGGEELTYRQVDERANQMAHYLLENGVGPDTLVGVCLDRDTHLVPALLGIWKASAAYLPLDPSVPSERLAYMLTDTGADLVLTTGAHLPALSAVHHGTLTVLDQDAWLIDEQPTTPPSRAADPRQLAYVIYTSGSTGRPKGVMIHHRGLANYLSWTTDAYAAQGTGGAPLFSSISFDLGIPDLFTPLITGRPVTLLPTDLDTAALGSTLAAHAPFSFIKLTPGHLDLLTHQLTPAQARDLAGLVIAAGDSFTTDLVARWRALAGPQGTRLATEYGPTEITIGNSGQIIDTLPEGELIPLGASIPNSQMYVLTDDLRPAPTGVAGEVYIAGVGLARGYLGRPDLTAERFLPDPYGPPGTRLYRTGDLGRFLPDGSLDFLGRIDNQVKLRGYRIELGEIEARLRQHPTVAEAIAAVRRTTHGVERLVAYVVTADGTDPDQQSLRGHLSAALPDYMVPTGYVRIDAVPLTRNGKVDHRALAALDQGSEAGTGGTAPRTPVEERLAAVWADVLGLDELGVEDSFFALGGDSIAAVRLVGALREAGHDVTVRDVFEHRTVADLAVLLAGQETEAAGSLVSRVAPFALIGDENRAALPSDVVDAYPLSQIQTGMLVEMLAAGPGTKDVYHNVNSFRVPDEHAFSPEAFRAAVDTVVARHDVLRTSMHLSGYSQPLQLVHAEARIGVQTHDVRTLGGPERERAVAEYVRGERDRHFDLATAPLLRFGVHIESHTGWSLTLSHCHAVTEGWTLNTLLVELLECYRRLRDGGEAPDHEAPSVRYADFVAAELASVASEEDRAFWREVTDGHVPVRLPEVWGDPEGSGAERLGLEIPFADLEGPLRELARTAGTSLKSVLLAAHLKVLSALSPEGAFHAGVVYHGRLEAPGAERVLGMHLNTLPFPATCPTSGTWREWVERVYAQETEIWAHRRYPLPAIQRDSGDGDRLVSVLFEHQDFRPAGAEAYGSGASWDVGGNEFPLNVVAADGAVRLGSTTDVISRENLRRLGSMYRRVLEAMAGDQEGGAGGAFLPEGEFDAAADVTAWRSGHALELFAAQVTAAPEGVAVVCGEQAVTYGELEERSNRLAHHLRGAGGVVPGGVVGLALHRTPDVLLSMLAVWKVGAAYLPIDPALPAERAAYMAEDAGATLVVTDDYLAGVELDRLPAVFERVSVDPEQAAYVLYTSGSTGRPKGVVISHRALHNLLASLRDQLAADHAGVWLASTSISFDISGLELHLPLISGGRVVLAGDTEAKDATALIALTAAHGVTHVQATPSGWRLLLAAGFDDRAVTGLVGGESLNGELARELGSRVGRLVNVYGPTETTIWSSVWEVPNALDGGVSIGDPLANTQLYVLDAHGRPVPSGVVGELCIAGDGLAHGYHGRPGLTAEKFAPNPYGPAGSRLYRTGDLARRLSDGTFECLGRIDSQVKVRGYRIELGEIEARLREHPDVTDAVVTVREDQAGDKTLVAYLVGDAPADLRRYLGATLPEYMVPAAYVTVEAIPLTNSGKVDHRALPAPDQTAFAGGRRTAPRTPSEERLAAIWATVLEQDEVGVEDSFFDLGGDSIRAVRLVGALRAAGYDVDVRAVFEHRTIAALAMHVTGDSSVSLVGTVEPFALIGESDRAALPADAVDAYPLSQIQTGMLVEMLAAQEQGRSAYQNINSFRIPDDRPFSAEAFRAAVEHITQRHEMLRTSIDFVRYGQPLQVVHSGARVGLTVTDVRGRDSEQRRRELVAFFAAEEAAAFELSDAPLIRMAVHVESDEAWRITFTYVHAIADGWSYHSLVMELLDCYRRLRDGGEVPAYEAPAVRYADFVAAELASLDGEADRAFWQDVVERHTPLPLPDAWRATATAAAGASEPLRLRVDYQDLEQGLRGLAALARTSLKSVLLAAHLKVLSALTAEDAFHTGVVYHGRLEAPGAERVLGMHLNTLPFPATRPSSGTWRDLVERVHVQETEIWAHRRYPLPAIQRDTGDSRRLIPVMFDFQDFHQVDTDSVDVASGLGAGVNEFALGVVATGGGLVVKTHTGALSRAGAERLTSMYRLVLEAMAADPDGDATAAYLPDVEQTPVSRRTEATSTVLTLETFVNQASTTPEAVAVVWGEQRLTYRELEERSSRLAHHLRSAGGVVPGGVVGLALHRTPDVLVSMLAVWKAGAAYLPIDPSLPVERAVYMAEDAGATLVVTYDYLAGVDLDRLPAVFDTAPVDPEQAAYVLYTSGSTGRPKGVVISHRALFNLLASVRDDIGTGRRDAWLASTSISFDISGLELHLPLITGGRVVLADDAEAKDATALIELMDRQRVTHVQATPSGWRLLLAAGFDNYAVTALTGGEPISAGLARELITRVQRLVNVYGPTETTIWSSFWDVPDSMDAVSIGGPLANTQLYVLDSQGRPVPDGITGELCIAGDGLAHGYHGRPGLTAEKFTPNPYGPPGSRLYRTGDLARRLSDGTFECLGRMDSQVKVRGYRIELGEIESRLREHPAVTDAVVVARADEAGDKSLVAYVVGAADAAPLREHLGEALPDYMVPAAYVAIDAIPLTNSGKVDQRALPAPGQDAFSGGRHLAPRTPDEERLAAVWREILGLDRVGVEDSFFDLGGDSIRAIRLVGALRAAGYDIGVQDVFEQRTVAELARVMAGQDTGASLTEAVAPFALIGDEDRAALPADVVDAYPLSQIQTGMLVEMLARPDSGLYYNINSFRIPDERPYAVDTLRAAVRSVVQRHDVLRTSIAMTGYSQPLQLVHATADVPVATHDWRGLDRAEQERLGREFVTRERSEPFDLTTAPLLRFAVHVESDTAWRLTLSHCHAVTDGWTVNSLLTEVLDTYRRIQNGDDGTTEPAPLAVRYADFIAAELTALASTETRAFWSDVVAHAAPTVLPANWAATDGSSAERHWSRVPFADLEPGLRRLATRAGGSLKSVLLAAHLKVLSTLTAEEAFHTGVVYHGRLEAPDAERVLGMHLNTLPFPATRPSSGTWLAFVEKVFAQEADIWAHRRYPLPVIQRDSGAGDRLLTILFDFQDFHQVDTEAVDVEANLGDGVNEFALSAIASGGHLNLGTTTDVASRENVARLASMYRRVLEAMAADPDGDAGAVYLPEGEEERLLGEWGAGATVEVPVGRRVHEAFAEQAARTPERTAVVCGDVRLTYADVDARANRLAHHLRELGAGPDMLVGLSLERGIDLIPSLLGVLKSGAAYLPLDPANPDERLATILEDAAAPILVTQRSLVDRLSSFAGRLVVIDEDGDRAAIDARPSTVPVVEGTPDDLIYVIYTSGSTGKPKGVGLSHANVLRLFSSSERHYGFGADDVWPLFHSYAFDVSVWEMWGALLHGGTLVVVPAQVTRSPEEFLELLVEERATILCQTPTAFRSLTALAGEGDPRVDQLALRAVVFAGERLDLSELRPWTDRVGVERPALVNMYGITETTVHSTYHRITDEDLAHPALSPVGYPLADTAIHLLDAQGRLVPVGVPGEIHVSGPAVSRGYLGRPELTAERFVPNPFGPAGSMLYRSGDLALRRPDGSLESLGRIDKQVKIRGYRIELGEIETRLREHAAIKDAVVVARERQAGEKSLVAYLVGMTPGSAEVSELRGYLSVSLPDYMVPSAFVALDAIPLTTNGKLDHRALPAPDQAAYTGGRRVAPRTPVEERLAEVWAGVLDLEEVGVEDSFFEVGGDSIRVVRLVGALRAAGYDVEVREVFEHRTIAALAALAEGRSAAEVTAAVEPFALISVDDQAALPADAVDAYPLSQIQTGMVVEMLAARDEGRDVYHNINSFRIPDERPLDAEVLRRAVDTVVARHDILRTSVHLGGYSQPLQVVHGQVELTVNVEDLRGRDVAAAGEEFAARERARGFDLGAAPLMRICAHVESDDAWRLTVSHCHAVTEGWTLNTFLMELLDVYEQLADGGEVVASYEAPSVRYADYIAAELASLDSEDDRAFWQNVVGSHTALRLPTTWADANGDNGDRYWVQAPFGDLEDGLQQLAERAGASLKSVLLAAHLKVLSMLTAEEAFHTGVVYHGRLEAPDAERVLGMHLNTLPFPATRPSSGTWLAFVEKVFAQEADIWAHRRYPLPAIQRDSGETQRLVTTLFDHQNFHQVDTDVVDTASTQDAGGNEFALSAIAAGGNINLGSTTQVISREDMRRLASMYRRVLEAMAADPDGDAGAVYLPEGEQERLLGEWCATVELPVGRRVHEAFAEQAARTPDHTAVTCGDHRLTYAELDARANRLAHHLIGLGAGPDTLVGLSLERGIDLIPSLLGVLKSGAAYLPLDPANPDERLATILEDAAAPILVTQRSLVDRMSSFSGRLVVVDDDRAAIDACPSTVPMVEGTPDDLIYVIYTSGSTGKPKGVGLSHANVLRLFSSSEQHYGFGADDVWPLFHSYAFDVSVWEMWGALLHGGTLVVVPAQVTRSPEEFLELLVEERATILCQTPTAFRSLTALAGEGDPRVDQLALRAVVFAGERLDLNELRPWTDRVGIERPALVNMYGITETTVHSTYHRITDEDLAHPALSPVGYPLADTAIHLLDARGHLVPVGVPGEIHVSGPAVSRGYLGRPELTAERFLPDPYGPAGSRLYRSGDLALRRPDGSLESLGRIDKQVKIRGYRIELGEIETRLREHPAVRGAVVVARESQAGEKSLVAYVVGDADAASLREHLAPVLPDYMVPAAYVAIDAIPLTTNGKLDHRALPAPDQAAYTGGRHIAPRTPAEERLAAVWREILDAVEVGVEDSFFEVGGDSIRAVRLVGALRAAGYDIDVREIFEHRTIAALAARLSGQGGGASLIRAVEPFALVSAEDRAALPADVVDAYPLSQIQTGMLVELLRAGELHTYHNLTSFRIPDEHAFSVEDFRAAVDAVVARHDILRTSMHLDGFSQPLQLVHATAVLPVTVHDWRGLDAAEQRRLGRVYADEDRTAGFDLGRAPLLRIGVQLESDTAWRLTLSHCHAATEGWSYHSLLMEILDCYRDLRDGREPAAFEAPAVRYADFVAAELASLASDDDRAFWQDVVRGHAPLTLPDTWADEDGHAGDHHRVYVPFADLEEGLGRLAARARTSLKSVLLAAHLKVLSTVTTEDAFHTGVVYHGRLEAPDAERVLGMHLNTLPFPAGRPSGSWRELVERVYAQETDIWAHRRYPLPAIQRDTGESQRLISVLFEHQNFHQVDRDAVDVDAGLNSSPNEFALSVVSGDGRFNLGTSTDVLGRAALRRLGDLYRQVLEAMAADPDGDATVVPLAQDELTRLLADWNSTDEQADGQPVERCVHEAFAAQAARTPDHTAVTCGDRHLTYAELDERANRLGHRLRDLGADRGTVVAVLLDRDLDLMPTLLGVLKSGAAYVPLDPHNPDDRLVHILTDARAGILVSASGLADRVTDAFEGELILVDTEHADAWPATAPEPLTGPDDLAYVIYTSGSTGTPKGVGVSHANVLRLFRATREQFAFGDTDVMTQAHSYAFDVSVWEMWSALLHGGRLVVVPTDVSRSPEEFLDLLVAEQVTVLLQTPTAFRALSAPADDGDPRFDRLALRLVGFGGEKLETAELRPWVDRMGLEKPVLVNLYGPTETTMHACYHRIGADDLAHPARSVIGHPLSDLHAHILDPHGRLVPVGVPGELYVGGPGVARGYLGRPALTAERFVPDPYGPAGARLYRTGDLARRLPDGSLDFLGRIDSQVKVRGYRIELGEIEARLREHPAVRDAVVTLTEPVPGHKALTGYVVPAGPAPTAEELRDRLADALPDYMVPAAFVTIDTVPLTTNGKLDHRALPLPDRDAFATAHRVAPRTPVEERLAAVWADVLDLEEVGVEDSFFEVGGDSIRAVRLVGGLRAAGYDVEVREIFEHRTIAALAVLVDGRSAASATEAVEPFALISDEDRASVPADAVDAYPLSQIQTGMVVEMLAARGEGRDVYHNINSFRIPDERPLDVHALQQAVDIVVGRHDILRTSVHLDGFSQPLQVVHARVESAVEVVDLRGQDVAAAGAEFAARERARGFELTGAPLMRFCAHVESEDVWRLTVSHCHAVTEGWTLNTFLMELLDVYGQLRDGREVSASYEAPSVRYADYIAAELASLASDDDRAFWQNVVGTHTPLRLPATWADEDGTPDDFHWAHAPYADLEDGLRRLATQARTSLKSVLLAAHLKVLSTVTTEDAFHTGVVYHGRLEAPDAERVLGMHLNTLPFPATRPTGTWHELVGRVYAQETDIWAHRRYPLPAIQRDSGETQRLITTLFDHQNFHQVDTDVVDTASTQDAGG